MTLPEVAQKLDRPRTTIETHYKRRNNMKNRDWGRFVGGTAPVCGECGTRLEQDTDGMGNRQEWCYNGCVMPQPKAS